MKKLISLLLTTTVIFNILALMPTGVFASKKTKHISLKKSSVTLKINENKNNTVYGKADIKLKKLKDVTLKKVTYKSSDKKVASVSKKGRVTAKAKGKAKITVKVSYVYKKKAYKKSLKCKVTVNKSTTAYKSFLNKLSAFSNKLYKMSSESEKSNYVMSPVSVYMAVAMLYNIGDDSVKSDIEKFTGMKETDLKKTGKLFKELENDREKYGIDSKLLLTNSIWYDSRYNFNQDKLTSLQNDLYCFAHKVPFSSDNANANEQIREFIKNHTNGLIDRDFNIASDTLLSLINTLYFKDAWGYSDLDTEKKNFKYPDGNKKHEFLFSDYEKGRVQETKYSEYFFAETFSGYKLKFILPKKGCTLKQAMSADNLNKVNNKKNYQFMDSKNNEHYTSCIFPSYKIECDTPIKTVLDKNNAMQTAFKPFASELVNQDILVSDISHSTVLDVNKKGIEGAAVTMALEVAAAAPVNKKIYHEFTLNRNFGFIITDPYDVILFEGQVVNP